MCSATKPLVCLILECVFEKQNEVLVDLFPLTVFFCAVSTANHGTPFEFVVLMNIAFNKIQLLIWQLN